MNEFEIFCFTEQSKHTALVDAIMSVFLISGKNCNQLLASELDSKSFEHLRGELIRRVFTHNYVELSYCVERERIICKFIGEEDWSYVCEHRETKDIL